MSRKRGTFMNLLRLIGVFIVAAAGLASILATGGGGGGGGGGVGTSSGGTGSVALYVSDGPADLYDHIYIWITRVELLPMNGSGTAPVVIYKSSNPEGCKIDLLNHRDGEDFFLTLRPNVPAGWYDKVRLYVSNIESVGEGTCDLGLDDNIKLPSGKIDLNPREPFQVKKGEALAIRLDIDANKSINLHPAGKSGKCIFRPVIFVDIEPLKLRSGCPETLQGEITRIVGANGDGIAGFVLTLPYGRGTIDVLLSQETAIFDENGEPGDSGDLKVLDSVWVRGRMDSYGKLNASVVAVGNVLVLDGMIKTVVDPSDQFVFLPDSSEAILGPINVQLFGETIVLVGCDTPVDWEAIEAERRAKVVGKYDTVDNVFRGIVVFLKELEISGNIISVDTGPTDGLNLVVQPSGTTEVPKTVFVPSDAPVYLEGNGEFPRSLLCEGREVRVTIDPDIASNPPTAKLVRVISETLEGVVQADDFYNRILVVKPEGGEPVYTFVPSSATILDVGGGKYQLMHITSIMPGDVVRCFGVPECSGTIPISLNDFYAFVILVIN
jgi:hypothetical protein